jgi:hypothetical protein
MDARDERLLITEPSPSSSSDKLVADFRKNVPVSDPAFSILLGMAAFQTCVRPV